MRLKINRHTIFPTILNVLGLTLAFSVFMILSVQVSYDLGYDLGYPDADKIVRLEYSDLTSPEVYEVTIARPMIEHIKQNLPQAEAVACYRYYKDAEEAFKETGSDKPAVGLRLAECDSDILGVFPFEFVQGDTSLFREPWTAVISEKGARKLFGDLSPIGREIEGDFPGAISFRIVAVYKDFPSNSSADIEILFNISDNNIDNWSEWSYQCYMKLSTTEGLEAALDSLGTGLFGEEYAEAVDVRVTSLHDAYYSMDIPGDNMAKGNKSTTITLLSVSILVLIIALINFINFAMASVPFNIRDINTRRVLGSSRSRQIWRQIARALVLVLISFALSIAVMVFVSKSSFSSYISGSLKLADNLPLLAAGFGIAVLIAFVAGTLPARYSTSFNTAMVLKGSFSLSASGRRLRTVLVGFQYVASFILILCALFITVQIRFMKNHDMGFERDQILEFSISDAIGESRETFRQMLLENPDIQDVTFAGNLVVSQNKMGWGRDYQGNRVQMDCLPVARNFVKFFGMEMVEGRDFNESDDMSTSGSFIVNESFMVKYPFLRVGLKFTGHQGDENPAEIVGIVRDFNFQPLQYRIAPLVLYDFGSEPWWPLTVVYVKINTDNYKAVMDHIRTKCAGLDPNFEAESMYIRFMDEGIGYLYNKEEKLNSLITTAAIISLLISIVGIFGLVYFETQFRRKEIALRRVNGAQVSEILLMLNSYYLAITLCCFVIAVPLAIIIMRRWVSGFAYQSPAPVWIFIAALLVIVLITIATVTLQSRRTALSNPSESLKTE